MWEIGHCHWYLVWMEWAIYPASKHGMYLYRGAVRGHSVLIYHCCCYRPLAVRLNAKQNSTTEETSLTATKEWMSQCINKALMTMFCHTCLTEHYTRRRVVCRTVERTIRVIHGDNCHVITWLDWSIRGRWQCQLSMTRSPGCGTLAFRQQLANATILINTDKRDKAINRPVAQ